MRYKVAIDTSGLDNDQKTVEDKLGKSGKTAGDQFTKGFKAGLNPAKSESEKVADAVTDKWKTAAKVVGASFAALTAGAVAFGLKSIDLASDLSEVQNVVDTTFGDKAAEIDQWSKSAGKAYGLSELAAKQYTSTLGAMLKSMGMSEDATAEMSVALSGLAGDMASFYNLDPSEAFEKLRSGISGETEPLKQLGINMSVANLEAFALEKGLLSVAEGSEELATAREELSVKEMKLAELRAKGTATASQIASAELAVQKAQDKVNDSMTASFDDLDAATQAQIRYQFIMEATADAQGDFSKTSDSLANQQRILQMEVETLSAQLGEALLPAALGVVEGLRSLVDWASQNKTAVTILAIAITGITAAIIAYSASLSLAASGMTLATAAGAAFGAVVGFLTSPITLVIAAITALVAAGVLLYNNWNEVTAWAASAWESIKQSVSGAIEAISEAIERLKTSISEKMRGVRDAIVNGFNGAVEYITSLPDKAKKWGSDFVQGLIDGITSMAGYVANAAKDIASNIAGFLHFSRPDVGPLREYEQWMPDMARGLAAGILKGSPEVEKAAESMAWNVSDKLKRKISGAARWAEFSNIPTEMFGIPAIGIPAFGNLVPGKSYEPMHSLTHSISPVAPLASASQLEHTLTVTPTVTKIGGSVIEVPVILDGREIARASAWYVGEQLAWEERR